MPSRRIGIASGQLVGPDTPVRLKRLEIPQAVRAADGTAMELDDLRLPLLQSVEIPDNADRASWRVLDRVRSCPSRATSLVKAVTVLIQTS